ncbi:MULTISPECIES: helix-turn-helix transcriptional regulator [unclassified Lonepinella]|uniref:helix-turn-helix transcriptional regulator n=1 Tax=unclassified Lonepinella TaxID=2642006 RepID=UPI0036DB70A2
MNNLAKARESVGLTQYQLGEAVGRTQNSISYYELGMRKPSLFTARQIVKKLNELGADVSLDDIFPAEI